MIPTKILLAAATICAATACSGKNGNDAADSSQANPEPRPAEISFSADSAYRFVADQVAFGPRVPGTDAHARCADYIIGKLKAYGADVTVQDTTMTDLNGNPHKIKNIIGRINPEAPTAAAMLLAHYDTRPWADQDPDPSKHSTPIDGANDGASGVAVMLEIARNASSLSPDKGIDLLFVDAEDGGQYSDDLSWCLGSQLWAASPDSGFRPVGYALLLDMVGGKDARFNREYFSEVNAPGINNLVWSTARSLGYADRFPDQIGGAINDDHVPLLRAGIPAVDIIETHNDQSQGFNPTWHTTDDNLSNIDPVTLGIVGRVVTKVLQN